MARVFNICFQYKGSAYTALVSVAGNKPDDSKVNVTSNGETIQILLPSGRLIFSISDVVQRLYASNQKDSTNATLYITENISLQLMNSNW
jgi:hypothetical protein